MTLLAVLNRVTYFSSGKSVFVENCSKRISGVIYGAYDDTIRSAFGTDTQSNTVTHSSPFSKYILHGGYYEDNYDLDNDNNNTFTYLCVKKHFDMKLMHRQHTSLYKNHQELETTIEIKEFTCLGHEIK
jgi:hypothetical protein